MNILKQDMFGSVVLVYLNVSSQESQRAIWRDTESGWWWLRGVSRMLACRERKALLKLKGVEGVPEIVESSRYAFLRTYIQGVPLHKSNRLTEDFFSNLKKILRVMHANGVCHNDLAKEPNILVSTEGKPVIVDFQLASCFRFKGSFVKIMQREDFRHILKHQVKYFPKSLTESEHRALKRKSWIALFWMWTVKPLYILITRKILGWKDREGAGDRF